MSDKFNQYLDGLAFKHISRRRSSFLKKYPQIACYSFDHIGTYINCFGRYELHELNGLSRFFVGLGETEALDIGANIGNHSLFFSQYFSHVHSFEPNPRTFELLQFNTIFTSNISIYKMGASNSNSIVEARVASTNIGGATILKDSSIHDKEKTLVKFEVKQLDSFDKLKDINKIGFIKLDVEGHEIFALEGMRTLLQKHKPLIAFEQGITKNNERSVFQWLKEQGYSNFYEILVIRTKIPKWVPKILRIPLRVFEIMIFNFPIIKIQKLKMVESKFYHMVIASHVDLNLE